MVHRHCRRALGAGGYVGDGDECGRPGRVLEHAHLRRRPRPFRQREQRGERRGVGRNRRAGRANGSWRHGQLRGRGHSARHRPGANLAQHAVDRPVDARGAAAAGGRRQPGLCRTARRGRVPYGRRPGRRPPSCCGDNARSASQRLGHGHRTVGASHRRGLGSAAGRHQRHRHRHRRGLDALHRRAPGPPVGRSCRPGDAGRAKRHRRLG